MRLRLIVLLAAVAAFAIPAGTAFAHHGHHNGHGRGEGHRHHGGGMRQHGGLPQWGGWHRNEHAWHRGRGHVCGLDAWYLMNAIEGDRFEIAGGNLALGKTSNDAVKTLAQTLVTDHTQSLQQAISIAQKLHIPVPPDPSPTQQWELDTVSAMTGAAFDHSYSTLEVADHEEDIDLTTFEVQHGCNKLVRSDAAQELPTLQHHLQLAQAAVAASPAP